MNEIQEEEVKRAYYRLKAEELKGFPVKDLAEALEDGENSSPPTIEYMLDDLCWYCGHEDWEGFSQAFLTEEKAAEKLLKEVEEVEVAI